jgi:hypothetical protein
MVDCAEFGSGGKGVVGSDDGSETVLAATTTFVHGQIGRVAISKLGLSRLTRVSVSSNELDFALRRDARHSLGEVDGDSPADASGRSHY